MKICFKCKIEKSFDNFHKNKRSKDGHYFMCKFCRKEYQNDSKYLEHLKSYNAKYYAMNKTKIIEKARINFQIRTRNDGIFRLKNSLRARLRGALKKKRWNKNNHLQDYIGCNYEDFRKYIESKFHSGMNWENYGEVWEIDHIKPLGLAKTDIEMYSLSHYSNLQPMLHEAHKNKTENDKQLVKASKKHHGKKTNKKK